MNPASSCGALGDGPPSVSLLLRGALGGRGVLGSCSGRGGRTGGARGAEAPRGSVSQHGKMTVMPLVEVTLVEGRSPEQLRTLISRLTTAVVDSVGAPKENVRVVLREVPATHWAAGDVTIEERRRRQEPRERQEAQS